LQKSEFPLLTFGESTVRLKLLLASEFEEKMKAWEKAQEPKMKEFEQQMEEWQKKVQPKMEEFQRKMEIWQEENADKFEEFQRKLEEQL
jgi:hypothetical protein